MTALPADSDTQHERGFLKACLDVAKYAELSPVKEAAAAAPSNEGSQER